MIYIIRYFKLFSNPCVRRVIIDGPFTDYFVTMPGSTPVKDQPVIKHLHRGRTATAIAVPGGISLFLLLIFGLASM